jgi:hypothetical protein
MRWICVTVSAGRPLNSSLYSLRTPTDTRSTTGSGRARTFHQAVMSASANMLQAADRLVEDPAKEAASEP